MATNFCLPEEITNKLKKAIKSGEIDIEKLSSASSEYRVNFFKQFMNERNAKEVVALFESKLLLKNQKRGLVTWAKQILGMKPAVERDVISRIMRMDKILNPENEKSFLRELASKKLGVDITIEEARKITELSNKIKSLENFTDKAGRIKYGLAKLDLMEYIESLNPAKPSVVANVLNLPRTAMTVLDLSAPLNQGWGMMSRKEFYTSYTKMLKYAVSPKAFREMQADIITRPTYKLAKSGGLRISRLGKNLTAREEPFMSNLLDKMPGVRGSERAYVGFLDVLRMDVFDDLIRKAALAGEDISAGSKAVKDICDTINAFSGGAKSIFGEGSTPILNGAFFSPRKMSSSLYILNPIHYIDPKISPTARKAATRNIIGSLGITATVLGLADLASKKNDLLEVDFNPLSSNFGKLITGNLRTDISGGNAGYITLLSRILTGKSKSSTTGLVTKLGGENMMSVAGMPATLAPRVLAAATFTRNKLSPVASLLVDAFVGANSIGQKKTIPQSVIDRFKPMFPNNLYEIVKDDSTGTVAKSLHAILALHGGNVNVYSIGENWEDKDTKELQQFADKFGEAKLKEANKKYNDIIAREIGKLKKDHKYQAKTSEEKLKIIRDVKDKAKKDVFKQYNFQYKKSLPSKK